MKMKRILMLNLSVKKLFFFLIVMLFSCSLTAGNYSSNLLSGNASLVGGSQAALASDSGALWYNPAGLGGINRKEFSLSGNGFMLRVRNNPGFMKTVVGTDIKSTESSSTEIFVIPSSIVMARSLSDKVGIAVGAFVPNMDRYDYTLSEAGFQDGVSYTTAMELKSNTDLLYYGLGLGWQIIPQFSAGFNLFGFYSTTSVEFATSAIFNNASETDLYYNHMRSYQTQDVHGILGSLGFKWEFIKNWHLGFRITTPTLAIVIKNKFRDEYSIGIKGFDSDTDTSYARDEDNYDEYGKLVAPMTAVLGFGYKSDKFSISAEIQFHAPADFPGAPRDFVINARAGSDFKITDTFSMGLGLFTDFSPEERKGENASYTDYFGITLGGKYLSSFALEENKKKDAIVFGTIVSLRYAFGLGKFGSVTFNPLTDDADKLVEFKNNDANFHEISLHISSELYFW